MSKLAARIPRRSIATATLLHPLLALMILAGLWSGRGTDEGSISVATASNFSGAMQAIAHRFEEDTGHRVILSFASTGSIFAQIRNGAPFDAFFAADSERPERLEEDGLVVAGSRFTYAVGRAVLWSPTEGLVDTAGAILASRDFRHIALANPRLAPYGRAAEEVLTAFGLWDSLQDRIVRGENIGQTFQFVRSGNAELGFVALSQLSRPDKPMGGSVWNIPDSLYSPIEQQAVALTDNEMVRQFMSFVRGPIAVAIIRDYGYDIP